MIAETARLASLTSEKSASNVRTHLPNVYAQLGALDRAHAVLMATEQGWI